MNITKITSFILCICIITLTAKGKLPLTPDFFGHWEINLSKSNFGTLDPSQAVAQTIFIDQNKYSLILKRLMDMRAPSIDTFFFSGKPFMSINKERGYITKSTISFAKEGNSFEIFSTFKDDGSGKFGKTQERTEFYTLSVDKKELILLRKLQLPNGIVEVKAVFNLIMTSTGYNNPISYKPIFDLSGNWQLNTRLSNVGSKHSKIIKLIIKQSNDQILIDGKYRDGSGEPLQLKFDGTSQAINNKQNYFKYLKFENEGYAMSIYTEGGLKAKDLYMLSDDGKILTVHRLNINPICFTIVETYNRIDI